MKEVAYNKKSIPFMLPVRCVIFLLAFVLISTISKLSYNDISKWWTSIAVVTNLITIAILWLYSHKKGITYKKLLNYERGTSVKSAILIITLTILVGMCGLMFAGLICYGTFPYLDKTLVQPIPLWLAILVILLLPLSTTLAEDGLYLSFFFYVFKNIFIPFLPDGVFVLYRFISFLPLTIIICFWYQKNKNPLPFMIGHFILNVATAMQILIMTVCPDLFSAL